MHFERSLRYRECSMVNAYPSKSGPYFQYDTLQDPGTQIHIRTSATFWKQSLSSHVPGASPSHPPRLLSGRPARDLSPESPGTPASEENPQNALSSSKPRALSLHHKEFSWPDRAWKAYPMSQGPSPPIAL